MEKEFEEEKRNELLESYLKRGLSIIPCGNDKKPLINWKPYQTKQATTEELINWCFDYPNFNIGVITGYGADRFFYSLDIDKKETFKLLPAELKQTMITETQRGWHLNYFSNFALQGKTISIAGCKCEFKGQGQYVVEPYAVVNDFEYKTINSIENIKPLPNLILDLVLKEAEAELKRQPAKWVYKGNLSCIEQILNRELVEGEREISLFILYNLLLRAGNDPVYSQGIVKKKNSFLKKPLSDKEIEKQVFNGKYNKLGCGFIKNNLPYVSCESCKYLKGAGVDLTKVFFDKDLKKEDMQVIFAIHILDMDNKMEIAKQVGINRREIYKIIQKLKQKGYL